MRPLQGLVLIEILLALAIVAILFGASLAVFEAVPSRSEGDDAIRAATSLLLRAEGAARAVDGDSAWGVRFENDQATLFKGASYDSRDPSFDENEPVYADISGTVDYIFEKVSGRPLEEGITTFTSSTRERTISVNAYGLITSE